MELLACSIALLAVTVIYLFWRSYDHAQWQRARVLRDRVAFMLWVLADLDEPRCPPRRRVLDNPLDVA